MRVAAIVEARMGSKRLPGKVMMPICGWPMLAHLLQRLSFSELVDTIAVVTPDSEENRPIWDFVEAGKGQVRLCTGPEDNLLANVLAAARAIRADVIVEITGDCPLIDPQIIDLCAGYFISGGYDFVGNVRPRTWPRGMCTRVFSTETLGKVDLEARGDPREAYWREHVSPWIYERQGGGFNCLNLEADEDLRYPELNLSVDEAEDLRRVSMIIGDLKAGNERFTIRDVLRHLAGLPGYEMLSAPALWREASWLQSA